jgi:hypothetical protein
MNIMACIAMKGKSSMYKVVREHNGKLLSVVAPSQWCLHYIPHVWTQAPWNTMLFVFRHRTFAINYMKEMYIVYPTTLQLWACDANAIVDQLWYTPINIDKYLPFWKGEFEGYSATPDGTYITSAVMLKERINVL